MTYSSAAAKYLEKARAYHVPQDTESFPCLAAQEFSVLKQDNVMLRAYTTQAMAKIQHHLAAAAVVALFSADCCLLKCYGHRDAIALLEQRGIRRGMFWDWRSIGPTAVSVGAEEMAALSSSGYENYHKQLRDFSIYYAPITQSTVHNNSMMLMGGIAVLIPSEFQRMEYQMLVSSLASEVCLHIDLSKDLFFLYEQTQKCILLLDINTKNGRITINHHNSKIFELFGCPSRNLYFTAADETFDPLPHNQELWNSIADDRNLNEQEMVLSVHGREVDCVVTTVVRNKLNLLSKSVLLTIESHQQATTTLSSKISNSAVLGFENIVGQSPALKSAIKRSQLLANTDSNIMIFGESGVGKDIFAQAIHNNSRRRGKPFIAVNCGALPRDLIESELFGYEGGAFTGARRQGNIGKFELANGGTIFLDEIGELPLDLQATLLRVVEQKKLMRLGGSKLIDVDVKIVSATNADISAMVEQQRFRADLYFRLSTLSLTLPPLRERGSDIVLLAEHFIRTVSQRIGRKHIMILSPEAKTLLMQLQWSGNVRELQNLMESIVQLYDDFTITPEHILENLSSLSRNAPRYYASHPLTAISPVSEPILPPAKAHKALTAEEILNALEACNGNRSKAAAYLGIARKTLYRNMERLGLS